MASVGQAFDAYLLALVALLGFAVAAVFGLGLALSPLLRRAWGERAQRLALVAGGALAAGSTFLFFGARLSGLRWVDAYGEEASFVLLAVGLGLVALGLWRGPRAL